MLRIPLLGSYAYHRNRTWTVYANYLEKMKEGYRLGYDKDTWAKIDDETRVICNAGWRFGPNFAGRIMLDRCLPAWRAIGESIQTSTFRHSAVEMIVDYGVVCNAGIADDSPFPALEDNQWDRVLRTDLDGFYNVLKPVVLPMISERIHGRIVAISSISGLIGNRGQVNYSAAKAGIIGAAKALAIELAKRRITVNCVAPGIIETDMVQGLPDDEVKRLIPMRRYGKPEEVAVEGNQSPWRGYALRSEGGYRGNDQEGA